MELLDNYTRKYFIIVRSDDINQSDKELANIIVRNCFTQSIVCSNLSATILNEFFGSPCSIYTLLYDSKQNIYYTWDNMAKLWKLCNGKQFQIGSYQDTLRAYRNLHNKLKDDLESRYVVKTITRIINKLEKQTYTGSIWREIKSIISLKYNETMLEVQNESLVNWKQQVKTQFPYIIPPMDNTTWYKIDICS